MNPNHKETAKKIFQLIMGDSGGIDNPPITQLTELLATIFNSSQAVDLLRRASEKLGCTCLSDTSWRCKECRSILDDIDAYLSTLTKPESEVMPTPAKCPNPDCVSGGVFNDDTKLWEDCPHPDCPDTGTELAPETGGKV